MQAFKDFYEFKSAWSTVSWVSQSPLPGKQYMTIVVSGINCVLMTILLIDTSSQ